ncbi:DUF1905 domain-containing protein [Altererythrobacter sp. H2]|jgi:hypothetical protein|uniref:DUF1905 domain-containing protein n=1 Tax=Altererythrobacter sp. H2 TaxID=3108391 RepID=UPI002B4BDC72|nr:DUF1905 domain-containing protein [Altererythrobacter sp. H2]WRK94481.1 DUF1905 domain-containing protein [Altererythrobacter sp. H2]
MERIEHTGTLRRWSGESGNWFFLTIDGAAGEALSATRLMRRLESGAARGFGSIRVTARVGESRWLTSVFPQKSGGWLLPIKATIRRAEGIGEGDAVECLLEF